MLALFCTLSPDYLERRDQFREEHLGLLRAAHERGELVMAGPLTDPYDKSLMIWTGHDESAVRAFLAVDPYVKGGIVTGYEIRSYTVAAL